MVARTAPLQAATCSTCRYGEQATKYVAPISSRWSDIYVDAWTYPIVRCRFMPTVTEVGVNHWCGQHEVAQ